MTRRNYTSPFPSASPEACKCAPFPQDPTPLMLCTMVNKIFEEKARNDEISLTNSGRHIMRLLSRHEGVTQLELANAANIKAPTVSVTLQKMEAEGMVYREADENDLRQTRVYLTPKGKAFNEKIKNSIDALDVKALEGFTEEEKKELTEMLKRLVLNILDCGNNRK